MNVKALAGLVIIGGLAVIGAVWFKKNKPKTSNLQSRELTQQLSSIIGGGAEDIDKPFNFENVTPMSSILDKSGVVDPILASYGTMTPEEAKILKDSVGNILSGMSNSGYDFSNIKIK